MSSRPCEDEGRFALSITLGVFGREIVQFFDTGWQVRGLIATLSRALLVSPSQSEVLDRDVSMRFVFSFALSTFLLWIISIDLLVFVSGTDTATDPALLLTENHVPGLGLELSGSLLPSAHSMPS